MGDQADPAPTLTGVGFDDLLREVIDRVHGALDDRARWQLLLDAVVHMAADLSLDELLTRIVEIAADLAGARYAALGVISDGSDRRLQTFVTHGLSAEQIAGIGELPRGLGLLGHLIDRPEAVRLTDIAEHASSVGFPPNHPPMGSFLGVPVRIREKVFGNLYLTEKNGGGAFTDEDQQIVIALAAAAGVAIENARLHAEAARQVRWLAATTEVTTRLLNPHSGDEPLQLVADRALELADADAAWVTVGAAPEDLAVRVVAGMQASPDELAGLDLSQSLAAQVISSGVPVAVEDLAADPRALDVSRPLGWPALGPTIIVPLRTAAGVSGVLALSWVRGRTDAFESLDPELPTRFAEQAALALEVSRARQDQQRLALLEDHERIGRDLHDLVIQRLFAVGLRLQGIARLSERPESVARIEEAVDELDGTIRDIRRTIFDLGSVEDDTDIQYAVTQLVDRATSTLKFRPRLSFRGPVRSQIGPEVAPDVLAVLSEALSNAARHAHASSGSVELDVTEGVRLTVVDDGAGLPAEVSESGLASMRRRAERRGGRCTVTSGAGAGTTVEWWVPAG
ncbi:sensor histidine kinase [Nocardioides aquiterrae]|uniref:Two-component system sensor histidine kinase n=1 Tax=Nocardioides aquiterrae TaxID=203799 RepID=A0ABN1UFW7_9ACTN